MFQLGLNLLLVPLLPARNVLGDVPLGLGLPQLLSGRVPLALGELSSFLEPGRSRADHVNQAEEVSRVLHDLVHEMDGSVSAEHGIGRLKVDDLERYGDPAKLAAMRAIKAALDPNGIMNPGAVLRA